MGMRDSEGKSKKAKGKSKKKAMNSLTLQLFNSQA
jgi:hypothetical protein